MTCKPELLSVNFKFDHDYANHKISFEREVKMSIEMTTNDERTHST